MNDGGVAARKGRDLTRSNVAAGKPDVRGQLE